MCLHILQFLPLQANIEHIYSKKQWYVYYHLLHIIIHYLRNFLLTHFSSFHFFCCHNDYSSVFLIYHVPKVSNGIWKTTLRSNITFIKLANIISTNTRCSSIPFFILYKQYLLCVINVKFIYIYICVRAFVFKNRTYED